MSDPEVLSQFLYILTAVHGRATVHVGHVEFDW